MNEELQTRKRYKRRAKSAYRVRFAEVFAYDPSISREEAVSSIPQVLALMNSPEVDTTIRGKRGGNLPDLIKEIEQDDQLTAELFLRCLGREPTKEELDAVKVYREEESSRQLVFEDLAWSLVNSAEFHHRR